MPRNTHLTLCLANQIIRRPKDIAQKLVLEHRVPIHCRTSHDNCIITLRCDCISFYKLYYSFGYIRGGFIVRFSVAVR